MSSPQSVNETFKDSTVFLTGATGFLGKSVLEKVLRCLDVKKVFILVRNRKGNSPQQRFEEIINSLAFGPLKEQDPDFARKIVLIPGDLLQTRLGISDQDRKIILKETNFVFHNAATTRFDAYLPQALKINFLSTRDLLVMAKSMPLLKGFVHVSTAYAHCTKPSIGEEIYESKLKPNQVLEIMTNVNDERLTEMTAALLGEWPNTYTFTKCLAENVVKELGANFPVAIVRPSIVIGAEKEPFPSYLDGITGINLVNVAIGTGILRVLHADPNITFDLIPLDYVVNSIIAAGWKLTLPRDSTSRNNQIAVYNVVTGNENPLTLGKYSELCNDLMREFLSVRTVVYPFLYPCLVKNSVLFHVLNFILHTIPAFFLDAFANLLRKTTPRMKVIYKKVDKTTAVLVFFCMNSWNFSTSNTKSLYQSLSKKDKEIFYFDVNRIDWVRVMRLFMRGTRRYVLKESDDTIPAAKGRVMQLKIIHHVFLTLFVLTILAFLWFSYKILNTFLP